MSESRAVDLVVLGGGTANKVASATAAAGMETVLVEKGPIGGTCLNRCCNPSKMLIQHANRLNDVATADAFGIDATVEDVAETIHVHPAMNRVLESAFRDAAEKLG